MRSEGNPGTVTHMAVAEERKYPELSPCSRSGMVRRSSISDFSSSYDTIRKRSRLAGRKALLIPQVKDRLNMIIGIDIDNTITHTTEMIMHYARIFGAQKGLNTVPDPSYYYLEDALGWDQESADFFLNNYLERIYREMQPKEQAIEVIRQLKEKHELLLITSRNQQFPLVEQVTRDWLERYSIVYDRLILNTTSNMHFFSKLDVCLQNGVQVMIEDHHDLIMELSRFLPVIAFDYPYNRHLASDNIIRVTHWNEVANWVDRLAQR